MYKNKFHSLIKSFIFIGLSSVMTNFAKANNASQANPAPYVITKILTEKPSIPSADPTKYNLSISESFSKGRNHFSQLDSKATSDVKGVSFSAEINDNLEYGLNYLYSNNKFQMAEDNRVERSISHDILPYGTYFFNADTFLTILGGGRFAPVKISQNDGATKGKTRTSTAILGAEVGTEKDLGLWTPSVTIGMLYENEKTFKYTLSDGSFTSKQWIHFLMGQGTVQAAANIHKNFQPYVKTGYQLMLRRSTTYTIKNWGGWLIGGGIKLFAGEQWNTSLDYTYNKTPKDERQSSFILSLSVNF